MPTAKQIADKKYSQSEKGKQARAKAWKKYCQKPEVKARRLELKRKTYKPKVGLYFNKFCNLYKICTVCKIEKSWLNFGIDKKSNISKKSHCKTCDNNRTKEYSKNNREKINKNRLKRIKNDPIFKLGLALRKRTSEIFRKKNFKKNKRFHEYLGCTVEFLIKYLESQFKYNMNWDNYGMWEIDHKIPLCSAKTEKEIYRLSHFKNLQPLWKFENRSKGGKF